jgi:hypothetical protein
MLHFFHPPQKFVCLPFWNVWRNGITNCGVEVTLSGMTSQLSFIKSYQLVKNLLRGAHRQNGDVISLTFFFKGKWAKKCITGNICVKNVTATKLIPCCPVSYLNKMYFTVTNSISYVLKQFHCFQHHTP